MLAGATTLADGGSRPGDLAAEDVSGIFSRICKDIEGSRNSYLGTAQVRDLQAQLAQPGLDPMAQALIYTRLGIEQLRLGDSADAVTSLRDALRLVGSEPSRAQFVRRRLGLAQLRLGEQTNCIGNHSSGACIVPLAPGAIHADKRGSSAAIDTYSDFLKTSPDDAVVQWLLNVAAMTVDRHPGAVPPSMRVPASTLASDYDIKHFAEIAASTGLHINQQSGGGIMEDFDGDGLLDIVTSTIDVCGRMNFFRNDGRGRFEDRSEISGLAQQLGGLNVVHADYDNDGDVDVLVLRGAWLATQGRIRNSLLRNDGDGTFTT